jgi:SSS family solute:Na+ symporter
MTSPAPYILMVGVLLQQYLEIEFIASILLATVISIGYVYWGGFRSVVQTDKLQFALMFGGFIIMFVFLVFSETTILELWENLDSKHKDPTGGLSVQTIIIWFLIASWTFIDPGFHQRCAAAKTPKLARRGILISILFWFIFDMLSITTGLYAVILLTDIDPLLSFPLLAEKIFSPFFASIFMVSLLAIIMSTVDSYAFLSAMTFGRDILSVLKGQNEKANSYTKFGLFLTGLISILLILWTPSVIQLWYNLGSLFIPPLLLPIILAYIPRITLKGSSVFWLMLLSFLTTTCIYIIGIILGTTNEPQYPLGVQPFFGGLSVSITLTLYLFYRQGSRISIHSKNGVR